LSTTTANIPTDADIGPNDNVMGMPTFDVDGYTFKKVLKAKEKNKRWKVYLDASEDAERIRKWANKFNKKPFMIRNRSNPTEHIRVR